MRLEDDCEIRNPISPHLPAVFQDAIEAWTNAPTASRGEPFLPAVLDAFDRSLAPVHLVLDELGGYLDPYLVPEDLLPWLMSWLGLPDDRSRSASDRRRLVAHAATLYRAAGTAAGLAEQLTEVVGWVVEIEENGAAAASRAADESLPGDPTLSLHVRFRAPPGTDPADQAVIRRLGSLVQSLKPAHVPHTVEVVTGARPSEGESPSSDSTPS
jgi:phage tail-like protein